MTKFSIRGYLFLFGALVAALSCFVIVFFAYRVSRMRVRISAEQVLVNMIIAFNNQPIRIAEEMIPEQYFKEPKVLELCHAISEMQHDRVRELMPGVDLNTRGTNGVTLLYWAYFSNDLESFKLLLQAGADPDLRLEEGYLFKVKKLRPILTGDSIFFALIEHGRYDFFYAAVPYTADVHQTGAESQNFLFRAVVYTTMDRKDLVRLVKLDLDLNARDANGKTIVDGITRVTGEWKNMQWLLELKADQLSDDLLNELYDEARIDDLFNYPTRTMAQWIEEHCSERIERLSVTEGLLPSQFFDQPEMIKLCRAISDRNFQELERLIETVDVNTQGANGITPLFWAYFAGNVKAFELLLEAGASPDLKLTSILKFKKERFGELRPQDSILFTLIRHDRYDLFFRALAYSADVRQSGYAGESLLHTAISSRNVDWEIMSRLVDAGVDVNARDQSGSHAFQSAFRRLSTEYIVVYGLKLAADKMSDSMIQSIFDDANDDSNEYSANFREVVEWMEKNIPERIPKSQRQSVSAGAIH